MTDELRRQVQALRAIAPRLNAATDEAARIVKEVQDLLGRELSLGITATSRGFDERPAPEGQESGRERRVSSYLAYDRVGESFRIHVYHETCERDDDGAFTTVVAEERIPWSSCPRQLKLRSFARLPELLHQIAVK